MTLREIIKELCKRNGVSLNKLELDLGFARGYVSKLDKSTPNSLKLQQIADYFNVTLDFLLGKTDLVVCPVCGFGNNPLSETSEKEHKEFHETFLNAKDKIPFLTSYSDSQSKKQNAITEFRKEIDKEKRADLLNSYFEALYSLELQNNGYTMNTYNVLSYKNFCSNELANLMLNSESHNRIDDDTLDWLDKKYEIKYDNQCNMVKEDSVYYLNDETAKIAQEIYDNKDLHILLDASRKAKPEDLKFLIEMAKRFKGIE